MLTYFIPWGLVIIGAALWVLRASVVGKLKIKRIREAIQHGVYWEATLVNDHEGMDHQLNQLVDLASELGQTMTLKYLHNDQDHPDLVTGFYVTVTP